MYLAKLKMRVLSRHPRFGAFGSMGLCTQRGSGAEGHGKLFALEAFRK